MQTAQTIADMFQSSHIQLTRSSRSEYQELADIINDGYVSVSRRDIPMTPRLRIYQSTFKRVDGNILEMPIEEIRKISSMSTHCDALRSTLTKDVRRCKGGDWHQRTVEVASLFLMDIGKSLEYEVSLLFRVADIATVDRKIVAECGDTKVYQLYRLLEECEAFLLFPFCGRDEVHHYYCFRRTDKVMPKDHPAIDISGQIPKAPKGFSFHLPHWDERE